MLSELINEVKALEVKANTIYGGPAATSGTAVEVATVASVASDITDPGTPDIVSADPVTEPATVTIASPTVDVAAQS